MHERYKQMNKKVRRFILLIAVLFFTISFINIQPVSAYDPDGAKTVTDSKTSSTNNFAPKISASSGGYTGVLGVTGVQDASYSEDHGGYQSQVLSKTASDTASGYGYTDYRYNGTGWVVTGTGGTNQPTISYSDSDGYSGTLSKSGFTSTGSTGSPPSSPSIGDTYTRYNNFIASYSGTVTKTVSEWVPYIVTISKYVANYSGTAYTPAVHQSNLGSPSNGQNVGEPVNIVTGNYYSTDVDISLLDLGQDLDIIRYYNSLDTKVGTMGKGWSINYFSNITTDAYTGNETITYPDGHATIFEPIVGTNKYNTPETVFDKLTKNADGTYTLELHNQDIYIYGTNKKLSTIKDRNENRINIQYDASNNIKSIAGMNGNVLNFAYESGKIKTITDHTNRTITYTYDASNNLREIQGLGGGITKYTYNSYGLTSATDENNKKFIENEYDEFARVIRQKDENLNVTEFIYDDVNKENTYKVITTGKIEKYQYNNKMYITKVTYTDNTYESYTYDDKGNKTSVRNRNGNVTSYTYDDRGNILTETAPAPLSYTKTYTYDAKDNITQISTVGGAVTGFEYDSKGNLLKVNVKLDAATIVTTEYIYDIYGRLTQIKDAEGNTTTYLYDGYNNLPTNSTDPEGNIVNFGYDSLGRRTSITTEYGTTTYQYNQQDKVIKVTDPGNNTTRVKYDAVGNLIKLIKPEQYNSTTDDGVGYTYTYDAMDRLLKQIDPLGNVSAAKYNQDGDKIKEINPNFFSSTTEDGTGYSYTYDGSNRMIKITNPSGQQSRIIYDGVGNITKIIDANNYNEATDSGVGIQYTYDVLNRLIEIKDTTNTVIKRYVYDSDGSIIKEIDAKGYNSGGSDELRYGTLYKYNLAGWMLEKRIPLKNESGTIYYNITKYSYDKTGKLIQEKKSQEYTTLTSEPAQWNEVNYTYYKNGNIKTITDSTGAYIEYSYDSIGNTVQQKAKLNSNAYSVTGYHYDSQGRLDKEWKEIDASDLAGQGNGTVLAETLYQYDKNGNVIKITSPEGYITNFSYDSAGKLTEKLQIVPKDQIDAIRSTASITSPRIITYPGQQYQYNVEILPDTQITELNLELEYDARVLELITATPNEADITINIDTIGKISISTTNKSYTAKTELAQLTFKIKNENQGTGHITISPISSYKNEQGQTYRFTELNGRTNVVKGPDMNEDDKVETNDFTLTAIQKGVVNTNPLYNEKFDIDNNGTVDVPDLDYIKDWLFAEPQPQLNKMDILRFADRTTESIYTDSQALTDRIVSFNYDKAGNTTQEIDSNGKVVKLDYDSYNRLIRITDKEGAISKIFYDEVGNVTKEVKPANYVTQTDDGLGQNYEYDTMNRLITIKNENNVVVRKNIYDGFGQLIKVIDAAGYQAGATDANRYGIEYTYDIGNRVTTIATPQAKQKGKVTESYSYDAMSYVIAKTDGEGNKTYYQRDIWGKITKLTDAKSVDTIYTYDLVGNLVEVKDGNNNTAQYKYNSLNLLSSIIDAVGQTTTYKYDKEGRMRQETDRNGTIILYDYNRDNNLISKKTSTGDLEERFLYYKDGSLLAAINSETVDTFEYTPNGYLKNKTRNGNPLLAYQYNKDGNVEKVTDGLGNVTGYTYDTVGRMQKVLDSTTQIAEYTYNDDNTIAQINYNNGVNITYGYDKDKNATSLINKNQSGTDISSFSYTYDNNGNQLNKVENGQSTSYTYDQLNRLQEVQYPGSINESFEYDNAGNRTKKVTGAETTNYTYDQLNRLTESTNGSILSTNSYDNNGNLLAKVENGQTTQYVYDAFNKVKETSLPNGTWQANKYDAFGMRLAVLENGLRYDFTTDRGNVITEINASGEQVARNIRGNKLIAQENNKNELSYYLHNAHGDVVNMVDAAGKILNTYSYDAFGNATSYVETVTNRFMYAGEQLDKLTGEYYLRARYYNPVVGRFTQEDTYRGSISNPQSLNLYSYVENNPIMYVDPSGHAAAVVEGGSASAKPKAPTPTASSGSVASGGNTKCDGGSTGGGIGNGQGKGKDDKKNLNQWDGTKALSPGNLLGTSAGGVEVIAEYGIEIAPKAIGAIPKPNNIGLGTWNKYIAGEISMATSEFGKVSKTAKGAGAAAIGIDVGFGIYDNIQLYNEGKIDAARIGTDAVVDTGFGLGSLATSTATGAYVGSVVPVAGTAIGAATGFATGVVIMVATEVWEPGGKSFETRTKDGFYGWWSQDNSNWSMPGNSYNSNSYQRTPSMVPQSR